MSFQNDVLDQKASQGLSQNDVLEQKTWQNDAMLSGDRILSVNDTPTDGLGLKELQQLLTALEQQEKRMVVRKGTGHKIYRDAVQAEETFQDVRAAGGNMRRVRYGGDAVTAGGMGGFDGVGPGVRPGPA